MAKLEFTEQEMYAILKGLNMISGTAETSLTGLEIFELQKRIEDSVVKTDEAKTNWFCKLSAELGHPIRKIDRAPNGGNVIYFENFNNNLVDYGKPERHPYWMLWTGDGADYEWHVEFGHWYTPKNNSERKLHPTTEYVPDDKLKETMIRYSELAKQEAV